VKELTADKPAIVEVQYGVEKLFCRDFESGIAGSRMGRSPCSSIQSMIDAGAI